MTLEGILSLFALMIISIGTYFLSQRLKLPYTVLLVVAGSLIVPIAHIPSFAFLKTFHLTPELLFYVFLPILIFESAYNMRVRELMDNVRSVTWFAVGSLLISMFFIAGALFFGFQAIGMEVPFLVTLLFGALISATDPVAVLALFKEFGVPRRLSFLFEGESLFNDGTALAVFLIVLEIFTKGFSGVETIIGGIFMFATMVFGGVAFGLFMGFLFAKFIEKAGSNEHIEITLTLLVAHLTFILSELISSHLSVFGHSIHLSAIIATVMASMVIGNYGRSKLSSGVEHFMERFWGYFAFLANSLVFITMGLLFAGLPINFGFFLLPIFFAVIVVMVARALSVYPVAAWLNFTKKERQIPMEWQHLMSWGSLRGALAVIMVMLIPDTLTLPSWHFDFTIKEFITALTIGCIYFTLFVKALTIGNIINRYGLSALTASEQIERRQGRAVIFAHGIDRLAGFFNKGYLDNTTYEKLKADLEKKFSAECQECDEVFSKNPQAFEQALRVYALGIERYFLRILYRHQEISESVYKRILTKLDVQLERVEDGHVQIKSLDEVFTPDWFEQMAAFVRKHFFAQMTKEEQARNSYMYYRAQEIIARKVIKEIGDLKDRSKIGSEAYKSTINRVISAHQDFYDDAHIRVQEIVAQDPGYFAAINEEFGRQSFAKACREGLSELARKNMLSPKLTISLEEEFSHRKI